MNTKNILDENLTMILFHFFTFQDLFMQVAKKKFCFPIGMKDNQTIWEACKIVLTFGQVLCHFTSGMMKVVNKINTSYVKEMS